jgi:hypothetical protein
MPDNPTSIFGDKDLADAVKGLAREVHALTEQQKNNHDDAEVFDILLLRATVLAKRIKHVARAYKRLDNET